MRNYELMVIVDSTLDAETSEKVITKINKLIEKNGGKVSKSEKWGRKKLAYPIKKYNEGDYHLVTFEGESETVSELERVLRITDQILRIMIVKKPAYVERKKKLPSKKKSN
ncbi:30S ribosomal protein S6 [Candidatus Oleimmundimicrobium sp.]|uniref:30S ribosomal protein S6 n=1 Tax=Candidatus Oleimmundimicrobium sp. TaxID=3060597 RepID=UPI002716D29F|nr:30S ribosomal protein S6 [Candidatus Oleimmundimicrobium sp.]MDO8885597.1 30S ribosomal protein S6 [Candidatus Oleimmundimicrobium sp.]